MDVSALESSADTDQLAYLTLEVGGVVMTRDRYLSNEILHFSYDKHQIS